MLARTRLVTACCDFCVAPIESRRQRLSRKAAAANGASSPCRLGKIQSRVMLDAVAEPALEKATELAAGCCPVAF